jgi:lipopolysaccharide biosynthesis glycosyltransferase
MQLLYYIKDILKQLDAVIYVDTDALFLADPATLWHFFSKFNEKQLIAIAANSNEYYERGYAGKDIKFVKPTGKRIIIR